MRWGTGSFLRSRPVALEKQMRKVSPISFAPATHSLLSVGRLLPLTEPLPGSWQCPREAPVEEERLGRHSSARRSLSAGQLPIRGETDAAASSSGGWWEANAPNHSLQVKFRPGGSGCAAAGRGAEWKPPHWFLQSPVCSSGADAGFPVSSNCSSRRSSPRQTPVPLACRRLFWKPSKRGHRWPSLK